MIFFKKKYKYANFIQDLNNIVISNKNYITNTLKDNRIMEKLLERIEDLEIISPTKKLLIDYTNLVIISSIYAFYLQFFNDNLKNNKEIKKQNKKTNQNDLFPEIHPYDEFKSYIGKSDNLPIFEIYQEIIKISPSCLKRELFKDFYSLLKKIDWEKTKYHNLIAIYELFIPKTLKKKFGQVYTPNDIADFMSLLFLKNIKDGETYSILDPASGSGILLNSIIIQRLKSQMKNSKTLDFFTLNETKKKIFRGIEINPITASFSKLLLNRVNKLKTYTQVNFDVDIVIGDFLDSSFENINNFPRKFDLIIANPPYIKQEKIPNKKRLFKELPIHVLKKKQITISDKRYNVPLSAKTDYYGFFIYYGTFFLKDKGWICFLIPNKWLDVKYGLELKQFLIEHYKIRAIFEFESNIFENAEVSNVVLLCQLCKNKNSRLNSISRFIKFKSLPDLPSLEILRKLLFQEDTPSSIKKIDKSEANIVFDNNEKYDCSLTLQKSLDPSIKWSYLYFHQSKMISVLNNLNLILMHNKSISKVVSGIKTGANSFYFPSNEDILKFQIEKEFLKPGIKSGREIPKKIILERGDFSQYFLSIEHSININNYKGIKSYIEDGDNKKHYPERPSIKWKPWYCIPFNHQDKPDILFLRHINKNFHARWNKEGAIVADGIRGIEILNKEHILFYLGVCNSTFFYWQAHIRGRWEGQGALQLLVYELKKFLIPDITRISKNKVQEVEKTMDEILKSSPNDLKISENLQNHLDLAVLSAMGIKEKYNILIEETNRLETRRLMKKL